MDRFFFLGREAYTVYPTVLVCLHFFHSAVLNPLSAKKNSAGDIVMNPLEVNPISPNAIATVSSQERASPSVFFYYY